LRRFFATESGARIFGLPRRLWNDKHGEDDVIASCRQSLADLRLD